MSWIPTISRTFNTWMAKSSLPNRKARYFPARRSAPAPGCASVVFASATFALEVTFPPRLPHRSGKGKLEMNCRGHQTAAGASNQRARGSPPPFPATMSTSIQSLLDKIAPKRKRKPLAASRAYFCRCGRPVFFRNSVCLACRTPLGFEPHLRQVHPLEPAAAPDMWQLATVGAGTGKYRRCANLESAAGCNWLLSEAELENNPRLLC